jgi:hypothetical protein
MFLRLPSKPAAPGQSEASKSGRQAIGGLLHPSLKSSDYRGQLAARAAAV